MKVILRKIAAFIAGIFMFCFLPLLGWGIADYTSYFDSIYRFYYFFIMVLFSLLVVLFVPNEGKGEGSKGEFNSKQKKVLVFLQLIPTIILISAPYFESHNIIIFGDSWLMRFIALFLFLSGYFLMSWSVMELGKQFSPNLTIQQNHKLIKSGIYKYVRHPRYLGIILFFSSFSIMHRSVIALLLSISILAVLLNRIKDEENLLLNEFGEEWVKYKSETKSLIPFVY